MALFAGIIPILPTPFDAEGAIDEAAFSTIVDFAIERAKSDVLAMFGFGSEFYKLTDSERSRLVHLTITSARGRRPVIISVTHQATRVAVEQAREAEAAGASGVMVLPPFVVCPGPDEIRRHIEAVAGATRLPVIVQFAPAETGATLDLPGLRDLVRQRPNISAIKIDSGQSAEAVEVVRRGVDRSVSLIIGYQGIQLVEALERGAAGCMPTVSVASALRDVLCTFANDRQEAARRHAEIRPLLEFMMQSIEMMVACEKRLLHRAGLLAYPGTRMPQAPLSEEQVFTLSKLAEAL